ncbi:hypothetical protein WKN59_003141 [Escherichia coli]|uniref:Uncharacterized protein IlvX n=24 Tax=Enterobacteriaceae TaxID=543 RepID=ILVX_ECOLI|nr:MULTISPECIES: peptide IlvX [Gammaproteobacteria]YP_002791259.1 uncharacterized protein IlvX [Escherichia coli str. K-12 substr. MG1655]C1P619.1 RecName: Full=Uncharacterized protein IlvX [Escherichia coli K-12]AGX35710.1 ilvX [synthetic Escherichia coli C321.deltaA]EBV1041260.1 hypothetical protein [Salmonella enterica subsp. enterica serovar Typhimurium]ECI4400234.1 hypothetical protein [Salmonella enterica subsp. enterica]EEC7201147.1 hypothetical protein [Escherichia coli O11]EEC721211
MNNSTKFCFSRFRTGN